MRDMFLMRDYSGNKSINEHQYDIVNCGIGSRFIQIPCGRCIGCRIDYKRSWADRLTYHSFTCDTDKSWFITLTYDEEHLDFLKCSNLDFKSLNYDDLTDFVKSVRNKFRDFSIDFFASGEYGDAMNRPHFHIILFNVPLDDIKFWKLNDHGDPIYISDTISDLWKNRGFCTVSNFSWLNAAYTAQYVEKKLNGALSAEYTALGFDPEKARCSRRPGIAYDYYVDNFEHIWKNGGLEVGREINSSGRLGIPRYFRKLALDKGIGLDAFKEYELNSVDKQNIQNPLKVDNSSFDLCRVADLLRFEEREILSYSRDKIF